jgi:sulfur carrier protein
MSEVTVLVNGIERTVSQDASVSDVLRIVHIDPEQKGIAVAVNDSVVRRPDWSDHRISSSDRIDIIQATQGG